MGQRWPAVQTAPGGPNGREVRPRTDWRESRGGEQARAPAGGDLALAQWSWRCYTSLWQRGAEENWSCQLVERLIPAGLDALILLVTALLSWLMPGLTRQRLLFGVTVPVGARESPVGRGIVMRYRVGVLGVTLLAALSLAALYALASDDLDRKSTRLNSSHPSISYSVFCLK